MALTCVCAREIIFCALSVAALLMDLLAMHNHVDGHISVVAVVGVQL